MAAYFLLTQSIDQLYLFTVTYEIICIRP